MEGGEGKKGGGKAISDLLEGGGEKLNFLQRSVGWAAVCSIFQGWSNLPKEVKQ